jgi:tetratricopeptide (TPR) repeat protein
VRRSLALGTLLALAWVAGTTASCARRAPPRVVVAENLGDLDPAVRALVFQVVEEVRAEPANGRRHGKLGLVYEANLLWEDARECFRIAARLEPEDHLWRYHLALASREVGDFEGALELLEQVVAEAPAFAAGLQRLGLTLLESGELERAEAVFGRLVELEPDSAEGYVGVGDARLRRGDPAAAAASLEEALARDPGYRVAHYLLGLAYRDLGRREQAARELALGAEGHVRRLADPYTGEAELYAVSLTARNERALGLLQEDAPAEAARLLTAALATRPESVTTLNNLAVALLHQGKLEEAGVVLERARALDDGKFSTYLNLSSLAQRAGRPEEALAQARAAVERAPQLGRAHVAEAAALARLGRGAEAREALETALRLDPRDPRVRLGLAELHERAGRVKEALAQYREAARQWPALVPALIGVARTGLAAGSLEVAEEALGEAVRLAPGHPEVSALERQLEEARPDG